MFKNELHNNAQNDKEVISSVDHNGHDIHLIEYPIMCGLIIKVTPGASMCFR